MRTCNKRMANRAPLSRERSDRDNVKVSRERLSLVVTTDLFRLLSVYIFSVAYLYDMHNQPSLVNFVDDTIVPDSYSI